MDAIQYTEMLRATRPDLVIHPLVLIYPGAKIGKGCKIQAGALIFDGVELEDHVFIGPGVTFTNVVYPSATKKAEGFDKTLVKKGAMIGANATILCGIVIGENAMIGCGAVVIRDVPDGDTAVGNPARNQGDPF